MLSSLTRPELCTAPELYYNDAESTRYHNHKHTVKIQEQIARRCIELLHISDIQSQLVLDIGCGSGISGNILTQECINWVGVDISPSMLSLAKDEYPITPEVIMHDIGQNLGVRCAVFDAVISCSVLQWLCYSYQKDHIPYKRIYCFFTWLRECLSSSGKACLQFYPENQQQIDIIIECAKRNGFTGGLVQDNIGTKLEKVFLVLSRGTLLDPTLTEEEQQSVIKRQR